MTERIQDCRKEISKWKRTTNLNSNVFIRQLRQDLDIESSKLSPTFQRMMELKPELDKVSNEEKRYWKQKSKEIGHYMEIKTLKSFSMVVCKLVE